MAVAMARSPTDPRVGIRSNVFLNATMVADGRSTHVRVRNISQQGALVDGSPLPPEGSKVELKRGSLSTIGEIAWRTEAQCGIRFAVPVDVPSWVRRVGQPGQERVDQLIDLARGNTIPDPAQIPTEPVQDRLENISADLTRICEHLGDVPAIVEQSEALLKLDAIAQRLANLVKSRGGGETAR